MKHKRHFALCILLPLFAQVLSLAGGEMEEYMAIQRAFADRMYLYVREKATRYLNNPRFDQRSQRAKDVHMFAIASAVERGSWQEALTQAQEFEKSFADPEYIARSTLYKARALFEGWREQGRDLPEEYKDKQPSTLLKGLDDRLVAEEKAMMLYIRGKDFFFRGDEYYDRAARDLGELVMYYLDFPRYEDARFFLNKTRFFLNQTAMALTGFKKLIAENPNSHRSPEYHFWQGECHYELGDLDKAKESFLEGLRLSPSLSTEADIRYNLGWLYAYRGETRKAEDSFKLLFTARLHAAAARYHDSAAYKLASLKMLDDDFQNAVEIVSPVIREHSALKFEAALLSAQAYYGMREWNKALELAELAEKSDKQDVAFEASKIRSMTLNELGKHDEALTVLNRLLSRELPLDSKIAVLLLKAETNFFAGDYYEAQAIYRDLLTEEKPNLMAGLHYKLARCAMKTNPLVEVYYHFQENKDEIQTNWRVEELFVPRLRNTFNQFWAMAKDNSQVRQSIVDQILREYEFREKLQAMGKTNRLKALREQTQGKLYQLWSMAESDPEHYVELQREITMLLTGPLKDDIEALLNRMRERDENLPDRGAIDSTEKTRKELLELVSSDLAQGLGKIETALIREGGKNPRQTPLLWALSESSITHYGALTREVLRHILIKFNRIPDAEQKISGLSDGETSLSQQRILEILAMDLGKDLKQLRQEVYEEQAKDGPVSTFVIHNAMFTKMVNEEVEKLMAREEFDYREVFERFKELTHHYPGLQDVEIRTHLEAIIEAQHENAYLPLAYYELAMQKLREGDRRNAINNLTSAIRLTNDPERKGEYIYHVAYLRYREAAEMSLEPKIRRQQLNLALAHLNNLDSLQQPNMRERSTYLRFATLRALSLHDAAESVLIDYLRSLDEDDKRHKVVMRLVSFYESTDRPMKAAERRLMYAREIEGRNPVEAQKLRFQAAENFIRMPDEKTVEEGVNLLHQLAEKADPMSEWTYRASVELATLYHRRGEDEKAGQVLLSIGDPSGLPEEVYLEYQLALGRHEKNLGKTQAAADRFYAVRENAAPDSPVRTSAHYQYADCLKKLDPEKAAEAFIDFYYLHPVAKRREEALYEGIRLQIQQLGNTEKQGRYARSTEILKLISRVESREKRDNLNAYLHENLSE